MSLDTQHAEQALAWLLTRRSVSPKRLRPPGPDLAQLNLIVQAALKAPDHGGLHPWRIIEFRPEQRDALAQLFENEKLRRDPLAPAADVARAREHALRPPVLLAFVVALRQRDKVPLREQWLSAGAALGNLLNAVHLLGFGAIALSGERCFDKVLADEIGLSPGEHLAAFVSIGTIAERPPASRPVWPYEVLTRWTPPAQSEHDPLTPTAAANSQAPAPRSPQDD